MKLYKALTINLNKLNPGEKLDRLMRIYGFAFQALAHEVDNDLVELEKIYLDKLLPKTSWNLVKKTIEEENTNWAKELLTESQKEIGKITKILGYKVPTDVKEVKDIRPDFRHIPFAPLFTPNNGKNEISNLQNAVNIALAPGRKIIIVDNKAEMTTLALLIQIKIITNYLKLGKKYNLGTATGSTTEAFRKIFGLLPKIMEGKTNLNIKKLLNEIGINYDQLRKALKNLESVATLDDYGWTKEALAKAEKEIGLKAEIPFTYHDEQWRMWLQYILKNEDHFYSPPIGKNNLGEARNIFHQELEKVVFQIQVWGCGSNGHGGFNEPGNDPLKSDSVVELTDITHIQNVGAFLNPREERPLGIFCDFAAEKEIYDLTELEKEMKKALRENKIPPSLIHRKEQWLLLQNDFSKHWNYLLKMIKRVPQYALTQGVGDAISRSLFHMVLSDRPHKSKPISKAIEGDISNKTTISGLLLAPNSVWIIEKHAARYLKNTGNYFFLKLAPEFTEILTDLNIDLAFTLRALGKKQSGREIAAELNITLVKAEELVEKLIKVS